MKMIIELDPSDVKEVNRAILSLDRMVNGAAAPAPAATLPGEKETAEKGEAQQAADEAGAKLKPPTPAVKKILDAAGVPDTEYMQIPRTGKTGNMTQGDARAYIATREAAQQKALQNKATGDSGAWPDSALTRDFPDAAPTRDFPEPDAWPDSALTRDFPEPAPVAPSPSVGGIPDLPSAAAPAPGGSIPQTAVNPSPSTLDPLDPQDAMRRLNAALGIDAVRFALQRFGVQRIRDLKPENCAAFVDYCDKVITGVLAPDGTQQ